MMLSKTQFEEIAEVAQRLWGLHLTDKKMQLVSSRLQKFLRKSPFTSVDEYLLFLQNGATDSDRLAFFDLLSTNVTSFFREMNAFHYLERELWTPLSRGNLTLPNRTIRIWSAACSTGPEPYSLGIHAHENLTPFDQWTVKIHATDLSSSALQKAQRAVYNTDMVSSLDKAMIRRHFQQGKGARAGDVRVAPHIREMVTFDQVNLMDTWRDQGPFDVVFCRNCMIYFDRDTRCQLIDRFHKVLRPGGILVIGSSETLAGSDTKFETAQPSVYVK